MLKLQYCNEKRKQKDKNSDLYKVKLVCTQKKEYKENVREVEEVRQKKTTKKATVYELSL